MFAGLSQTHLAVLTCANEGTGPSAPGQRRRTEETVPTTWQALSPGPSLCIGRWPPPNALHPCALRAREQNGAAMRVRAPHTEPPAPTHPVQSRRPGVSPAGPVWPEAGGFVRERVMRLQPRPELPPPRPRRPPSKSRAWARLGWIHAGGGVEPGLTVTWTLAVPSPSGILGENPNRFDTPAWAFGYSRRVICQVGEIDILHNLLA